MRTYMTAAIVLGLAGAASAQVWNEVGDAGQDGVGAAQQTDGIGLLSTINGALGVESDIDLYGIRITDTANFSASVVGGATFDTQLFLFAADGTGLAENDDSQGTLQSTINSDSLIATGSTAGIYYLAIGSFNNQPLDTDGQGMFGFDVYPGSGDQRTPTSSLALASWDDSGFGSGDYTITLRGAEFAIPAPGALALLGLGGLVAARRRR